MLLASACFAQSTHYLLIGTYTSGKSEGIYVYSFNSETGDFKPVSSIKSSNPSFLAVSPNQQYVYAVNENSDSTRFTTGGSVAAFSFDAQTGTLKEINKQFSGGKHPCHIAVDNTGKWVAAGNYSSGNLAILHVNADGGTDSSTEVIQHEGSGPDKIRQPGPHVHSANFSPDNKFLFVPDLGIDKVMIYKFNSKTGRLKPAATPFYQCNPGSGPRHFAFHPGNKYAYVIEELSGMVTAFDYKKGKLKAIQHLSAHPADFKGVIGSADIHVSADGKFLYCSNRGESNTIAIFSIDQQTGLLTLKGHQSTMGIAPRNFNFDPSGNFLLVANQQSDDIIIFKIDKETGMLTNTGKQINVPNPVCIKWIDKK
jgi:6-phosphogluconolactonase